MRWRPRYSSVTAWRQLASVLLLFEIGQAKAFWQMSVQVLVKERIDPLINPKGLSGHSHFVYGASGFSPSAADGESTKNLLASKCTSVPIEEDKSNYWHPALYFAKKDGSVEEVQGSLVIYYKYDPAFKPKPFPANFGIRAGNPALRTYDPSSAAQRAVNHKCLNNGNDPENTPHLPTKNCDFALRAEVSFPSCSNGQARSPNHDHVVYPLSAQRGASPESAYGDCPDTHPIVLPKIMIEVWWQVNAFAGRWKEAANETQPFVYSNGDSTGYSFHADELNGWKTETLEKALTSCNIGSAGGDLKACSSIFTINEKPSCTIPSTVNEQVTGKLPNLPGCLPIPGAPAPKTCTAPTIESGSKERINNPSASPSGPSSLAPAPGKQTPFIAKKCKPGPSPPTRLRRLARHWHLYR